MYQLKYYLSIFLTSVLVLLSSEIKCQNVEVIKFKDLENILSEENAPTRIINFWATWCAPCVKELPQFEALHEKYKSQNVEVLLVSLDFVENLDSKVKKFVSKKNLQSTIYLLDETDYNSFIDKIDQSWSGAIPATLILDSRKKKRIFFEKEFEKGELESAYLNFIKS